MPSTTTSARPTSREEASPRVGASYAVQISWLLVAAFTLSVVHTVYAAVAGLEAPDFTLTTPITWIFYGTAFAMAALARLDRRWVAWVVTAYLTVVLLIGVFYYPTTFEPHQQTTFGWFENDVYLGLLMIAYYLGFLRLRQDR